MKDQDLEQEWHQRFKQEADDLLFEDVRWDDRLQEKVLRAAGRERHRTDGRGSSRSGKSGIWRRYGIAAVTAAVLGIVIASSLWLNGGSTGVNPGNLYQATNDVPGTPNPETRALQTPEEAGMLFGDGFLVPTYAPDQVKPTGLFAYGIQEGKAAKIVMNYMYGDIAYSVIEDRADDLGVYNGYKRVEIQGSQGYLKTGEADAELHWSANGVHYAVIGTLSDSEAVKIAESMK